MQPNDQEVIQRDAARGLVYDVASVATLFGVSKRTIEHLITRGELRSLRIGRLRRIRAGDVDEYLARRVEVEVDSSDELQVAPEALRLLGGRTERKAGSA